MLLSWESFSLYDITKRGPHHVCLVLDFNDAGWMIKNMDRWFFFPNLQVRRHLAETGKTKIYGKRDKARVCGFKSGRNPRQDHEDEWRQLTCAKSIPMKFTSCKEHLPSYKTNTAMLFVTENKDSCDSTAALRFSGHKWQQTQRMWQLGGGERSPPPPPYNSGCHPL